MSAELAEIVVYTDRRGHGTDRAALVIMTADQNYVPPTEDELATLLKYELSPPRPPRHRPLAPGEVLLRVMAPGCDYKMRAVLADSGTYVSTPPPPDGFHVMETGEESGEVIEGPGGILWAADAKPPGPLAV